MTEGETPETTTTNAEETIIPTTAAPEGLNTARTAEQSSSGTTTHSGRTIKKPNRLGFEV